jgi:hypothetical protein
MGNQVFRRVICIQPTPRSAREGGEGGKCVGRHYTNCSFKAGIAVTPDMAMLLHSQQDPFLAALCILNSIVPLRKLQEQNMS